MAGGQILSGSYTGQGSSIYADKGATITITGTVSCRMELQVKSDVTGQVKQYLALADPDGYTFHRFYVGITKVRLCTSRTGFGYKARFCADPTVLELIDSFGFTLQLSGVDVVVTKSLDGSVLDTDREYSLLLKNFQMETYSQTPVNAQVFLKLKDGTTIVSANVAYSMRNTVEIINIQYETLSQAKKDALVRFVTTYASVMKGWAIENIK